MKVVEITPNKQEPNQVLINHIVELHEMAKSGELQSFFGVGTTGDCGVVSGWVTGGSVFRLLGAIEQAKIEFANTEIESRADKSEL